MDSVCKTHVKLLVFDLNSVTQRRSDPINFLRKGIRVSRAETLGTVVSTELKLGKFLKFTIDDGTGCIPCILWLNHLTSPYFSRRTLLMFDCSPVRPLPSPPLFGLVRLLGFVGGSGLIEGWCRSLSPMWWLRKIRMRRSCIGLIVLGWPKSVMMLRKFLLKEINFCGVTWKRASQPEVKRFRVGHRGRTQEGYHGKELPSQSDRMKTAQNTQSILG